MEVVFPIIEQLAISIFQLDTESRTHRYSLCPSAQMRVVLRPMPSLLALGPIKRGPQGAVSVHSSECCRLRRVWSPEGQALQHITFCSCGVETRSRRRMHEQKVKVDELVGRAGGCTACGRLPRAQPAAVQQLSSWPSPAGAGGGQDGADAPPMQLRR